MRNLLGRLLQRTPAELERIARHWSVELRGNDRHADVSTLYRTMTDVWAMRDVWERLSEPGKALIRALDLHDGAACPPEQIAEEAGMDPETAREELRALYVAGIVSAEERVHDDDRSGEVALFLPREVGMMVERVEAEHAAPSPVDLALDDLLSTPPFPDIEEAATAWGARVIPAVHTRGELVGIIAEHLSRQDQIDRMVSELSSAARNAWSRLKVAGGTMPLDELLPPGDVALITRRRILRELATPLLLWHGYDDDGTRLAIVPKVIREPAPVELKPPPELRVLDDADVIEPEWLFPYAAAWDLLAVLRDATAGSPRWKPLVEGEPSIVRRLRRDLWRTDRESLDVPTGYVPFLVRIGAMMGVLRQEDERAVPGDAALSWREHSFTTASQRMVAAWTSSEDWIEGQERVDANLYGASWPVFRETLIRALGELEADRWHEQASFVERLLRVNPDLLRQAEVMAIGANRRARIDTASDAQERRFRILALVVGVTLETACVWLGLIERSTERTSEEAVLRVTPFGHWIAGKRIEPSLPSLGQTPLSVGANFQVLLYRPTPRRVWALSAFAKLQSLDRVSTYALTSESLIRALASGIDLDQIVAFLERQNGGPLPQNVAYTLAEWDRGYRRVWLRRAVLLAAEEGEESEPIVAALKDAGLDPDTLPDGRIALVYDEPDAGERLFTAAHRALRERGFAPLSGRREQGAGTRE